MCDFADEIEPGLHLGSVSALHALAMAEAEEQMDWCVISVLSEVDRSGVVMPRHLEDGCHKIVSLDDMPDVGIARHFGACHEFIRRALACEKQVLVHCMAGISRSATIVAAHLMMDRNIGVKEALEVVRTSRECIGPNMGFRRQLAELESALKGRVIETINTWRWQTRHRSWRLRPIARAKSSRSRKCSPITGSRDPPERRPRPSYSWAAEPASSRA
jgi:predicted protein tyrosine phosphatase